MKLKKSLKKILAIIGLVTIVVPASITVTGCDFKQIFNGFKKSDNKLVVDAINSTTYQVAFRRCRTNNVGELYSIVCTGFIKGLLSGTAKEHFNASLFIKKQIVKEDGIELRDGDLQRAQTINGKIIYDYAEFKDQETNLIIKIAETN